MAAGFIVSSFYLWKLARKMGLNEEKVIDGMLLAAVFGFLGARAAYIFLNPQIFSQDIGKWLLFIKYPGLSYLGALIGTVCTLVLLGLLDKFDKKIRVWEILDLFTLPAILLSIFGYAGHYPAVSVGYALLFISLRFLEKKISETPEAANNFNKPGFFTLLFLLMVFTINTLLAKRDGGVIYYGWLTAAIIDAVLVMYMIKFPANVLAQIQKYLEERRAQTEHRISDLKKEDPFEDKGRLLDNATDDAEAHQKANHERTQALIGQMNMVLIETRKALARIKIGNYGICEKCRRMIDTDRLAAIPTATFCLNCEKKKEK